MGAPKKTPATVGDWWRAQGIAGDVDVSAAGPFDEIAVARHKTRGGAWLHVEMMNETDAWIRIGSVCFNVRAYADGSATIVEQETDRIVALSPRDKTKWAREHRAKAPPRRRAGE